MICYLKITFFGVWNLAIIAKSPDDRKHWGSSSDGLCGRVIQFFIWELGAGKPICARAAKGMQVQDEVSSPTFGLLNVYEGPLPLYHLDLYRAGDCG